MIDQKPVAVLIALQFAAFGWRINREIAVGDQGRRTWLPIPDCLNIVALIATSLLCVVFPLCKLDDSRSTIELSVAYVLIAMHPVNEAAHYRLFSRKGRHLYVKAGRDFPFVTDQETATLAVTALMAVAVAYLGWNPG